MMKEFFIDMDVGDSNSTFLVSTPLVLSLDKRRLRLTLLACLTAILEVAEVMGLLMPYILCFMNAEELFMYSV